MRVAIGAVAVGIGLVWMLISNDTGERWRRNNDCVVGGGRVEPTGWPLIFFDYCRR